MDDRRQRFQRIQLLKENLRKTLEKKINQSLLPAKFVSTCKLLIYMCLEQHHTETEELETEAKQL